MAGDFRRYSGASSTLSETISATANQIVVAFSSFPALPPFDIVIDSEILSVVGISSQPVYSGGLLGLIQPPETLTFSVLRGREGTLASKHLSGRPVKSVLSKDGFLSLADDKGYSGLRLTSGSSITVLADRGAGVFLIDPTDDRWREFSASDDVVLPLLSDGEVGDVHAYWLEGGQMVEYEIQTWASSQSPISRPRRDGVEGRTGSLTRRYVGSVQKQGTLYTPSALRVILSSASVVGLKHGGFGVVRLAPSVATVTLHGLQPARDGTTVVLQNTAATQKVVLKHNSGTALADEKFLLPKGGDLPLEPGGGVVAVYDVVSRSWRTLANCYIREPRPEDPVFQENALEDGANNLLAYGSSRSDVIFYQGN